MGILLSGTTGIDAGSLPVNNCGNLEVEGNLNLSGVGARITGDFSNNIWANRFSFQNSNLNTFTTLQVLPNGAATDSAFRIFNNSNPDNSAFTELTCSLDASKLISGTKGAGVALPLAIYTNGSERMRIESNGDVKLTTTPAQFDNDTSVATTEFVQRALGNLSGLTYSGTRTLTAADAGKLSGLSASGTIITLPLGSTVSIGSEFHFWNGTSNGTGTIQRQGTDSIYVSDSPINSISVNGGETLTLTWSGTAWYATNGSAILYRASSSFGASLAQSGYQKLPSGLIIQWGQSITSTNGAVTVTFPIAFPNACRIAVASNASTSTPSAGAYFGCGSFSLAGMGVWSQNQLSGMYFNWIAIGY